MKKVLIVGSLVFAAFTFNAQNNINSWKLINEKDIMLSGARDIVPSKYITARVNLNELKQQLLNAPLESQIPSSNSSIEIMLPMPNGSFQRFKVSESPVMEDELQRSFPNIRTYNVKGVDDIYASGKLDVNEYGFHAMIRSPYGDAFIDPYCKWNTKDYISYYSSDFSKPSEHILPEVGVEGSSNYSNQKTASVAAFCAGQNLKTYRLAIACTGEYARAACGTGTNTPTTAQILSKVVTTVNRVDGVYETEVAVKLVLVNSTTLTLYGDPSTDPFAGNNNASTLINESQTVINSNIGSANYDIGHTFSTGGGGLAQLGCVCSTSNKARGITGSPSPVGDPYDIDYVAHEVGHQFGGNHTFNGTTGSCSGNRNASTAMEPGSGVTIMAYAGICTGQDLASNSIAYFHAVSYDEITTFINSGGGNNCDVMTATGNNAPVPTISTLNYTVPANTPFYLTGSATDPDNDAVTYQWEEFDAGPTAGSWNIGTKPFFRSYTPTVTPTRYFPRLSVLQNGNLQLTAGEYVPTTSQSLKFRFTARDNKMGGGGVCSATTAVNTTTLAGPFAVTSQSTTGITYPSGSSQTVTWNVNNTDVAPINCANVNIYISLDNGNTWTLVLASTPNDGNELITLPTTAVNKPTCRVKVESIGHIFFAMNTKFFAITAVTGISQIFNNSNIKLYPNPFTNNVKIEINGGNGLDANKTFLNVYDVLGNLVKSEQIKLTEDFSKSYDFSDLANGSYIITVTDGKNKATHKLIKL